MNQDFNTLRHSSLVIPKVSHARGSTAAATVGRGSSAAAAAEQPAITAAKETAVAAAADALTATAASEHTPSRHERRRRH